MKIAIVGPGYLPVPAVKGGAVETLITTLLKHEHNECDVDIYSIADQKLNSLHIEGCNIIQIEKKFLFRVIGKLCNAFREKDKKTNCYQLQVVRALKNKNYDCILVENNMMLYNDIHDKYSDRFKMIFHLHNDFDEESKTPKLAKTIGHTAKDVICVSNYIKKQFDKYSETKNSKVIYNGIDLKKFRIPDSESVGEFRNKLKITDEIVFLYVGRIEKNKGVLELVKAFSKLEYLNKKLIIVGSALLGDEQEKQYYEKVLCEAQKEQENIIFVGQVSQENICRYYAATDVVVIPSLCQEAFCMTAAEAMAMGKPIIFTNSGGIVEVVDESCALCIEKDKFLVENLSNAMQTMCGDREMCKKMGMNALKRFNQHEEFTSQNYAKHMWKIIRKDALDV